MTYTVKDNEQTTPAMVYTPQRLTWGKLVHPESIRAQTWLKHSVIPQYLALLDSETLIFGGAKPARLSSPELYLPVSEVVAFHLLPPAEFDKDYDESEPHRMMKPVTASFDIFRLDGLCRIATIAEFSASLQSFREPFRSFYAATISHPTSPGIKPLWIPHVLVRTSTILYMVQNES